MNRALAPGKSTMIIPQTAQAWSLEALSVSVLRRVYMQMSIKRNTAKRVVSFHP
jgi:hypothetical protein